MRRKQLEAALEDLAEDVDVFRSWCVERVAALEERIVALEAGGNADAVSKKIGRRAVDDREIPTTYRGFDPDLDLTNEDFGV